MKDQRGSVLIAIMVLVTIIGYLSSVVAGMVFSRSSLYQETRGRMQAQKVTEGAYQMMAACLDENCADQADFPRAFGVCRSNVIARFRTSVIEGRTYTIDITYSGAPAPYSLRISARDAFNAR